MLRQLFAVAALVTMTGTAFAQTPEETEAARLLYMDGSYDAAMAVLVPAADAGDSMAQNVVGVGYQYGNGLPVDAKRAVAYYERSAAQGFPVAFHNLGVLFNDGMAGISPDLPRARNYFEQAIAAGYELSYSNLGLMLQDGIGGPPDTARAVQLLATGADMGDSYAADALAYAYLNGLNVPQNDKLARQYYQRAADLGLPQGIGNLGMMNEMGRGGPVDLNAAYALYEEARTKGHVYSGISLAWLIFENPRVFSDQALSLANCYWAVNHALPADAVTYQQSCDDLALQFSPGIRSEGIKRAQGL